MAAITAEFIAALEDAHRALGRVSWGDPETGPQCKAAWLRSAEAIQAITDPAPGAPLAAPAVLVDQEATQAASWWRVAFRCSKSQGCIYCHRAMRVGWASLEGYACPKCYQQYHGAAS